MRRELRCLWLCPLMVLISVVAIQAQPTKKLALVGGMLLEPMNFHTEALWREMKAFVDLGMSPERAISAATRIGARILGRGHDLGTIEAGKLADIIVVKGNPLFNIMALADVEVVVKDGVVYKGGPGGRGRVTESEP